MSDPRNSSNLKTPDAAFAGPGLREPIAIPPAPPADDELVVDGALLRRVAAQRLRAWAWKGPLMLAALLGLGLLLVPQSFTSDASVAIQQPMGGGSSPLALLAGSTQNKRYLGVLKSRMAAEYVESRVPVRQLYGLSRADALTLLEKSIKPDDNTTDGLLYVHVTLPGPPRFWPGAAAKRDAVKRAAAQAANAYTAALQDYYKYNDNSRDAVLLRGAGREEAKARAAFDAATDRAFAFARGLKRVDPRAAPDMSAGGITSGQAPTASASGSEIGGLYAALLQVEAQLRQAEVASGTQQRLVQTQLRDLGSLPAEDPLLTGARYQVMQDRRDLDNLQNAQQLGPDNPSVVIARQRLTDDQAKLRTQETGVRQRLTTPQVQTQAELEGLQKKQQYLLQQIAAAERRLGVRRDLTGEFSRLQGEAALRFEVLKTAMAEAARVRLDNVTAQSQMFVVDAAIPARSGSPGTVLLFALSLFLVVAAYLVSVGRGYLRQSRPTEAPPGRVVAARAALNGVGDTVTERGEDAEVVRYPRI